MVQLGMVDPLTNITMITLWLYVKIANENGQFIVYLPSSKLT
jgi:hypothetical protein